MIPAAGLAADLIATDVRYFELGARIESIAGARLVWMPGLADVMAGCVVLGAETWDRQAIAKPALDAVERRIVECGGTRVRLYLRPPATTSLADGLRERGYSAREEIGYILPRVIADPKRVSLRRIEDETGWALKLALHRGSPDAIDGHSTAPERWVELERRKSSPDGLSPWLIEAGGRVVGTVGTIELGGLLRLKNLLVHRDFRRRGVAMAVVAAFGAIAAESDRTLGLFVVEGTPGVAVYDRSGMIPVTRWVEWLGPPIEMEHPTAERP